MSKAPSIWDKIKNMRDELVLQAHLMSMELEDEWHALEKRFHRLNDRFEQMLLDKAQKMGEAEEHLFVGDQDEIDKLYKEYDELKRKQQNT